jgi:uncharacterized protein
MPEINYKKILIRPLTYLTIIFSYYCYLVFIFQWKFIFREFLLSFFVILIIISSLYIFFLIIDKIISKSRFKFLNISLKLLFIIFLFFPILITFFQIHRVKIWNTSDPNIYFNYENINFKTIDGENISGWYMFYPKSDKTIVFAHWVWANKSNFLEYAKIFNNLWYNILIFDFRGHWDSSGHSISFWYNESKDIHGGVNFIKNKFPDKTKKIYWVWFSMWGASMIYAQSKYNLFDKIIIDSSFAYSEDMINYLYSYLPKFYRNYLKIVSSYISKKDLWVSLLEINPAEEIKNIKIPILLFHSKLDKIIPYNESLILEKNIPNKNWKLILFETSDHVASLFDEYDQYLREVEKFLNN